MKNTKLTKFFVIALSLALLIGAAIGISASAETDGKVEIYAQTIVHNDKIALAYAPAVDITDDATAADGLKVEYKIGENGEWKTATKRSEVFERVDEDGETVLATYPVYATEGMPAQDFTEIVYAVAYTGDTRPEEVETYSVMQFLYTKLYKDGYINNWNPAHQGKADRDLYLSLINYAEKAQIAIDKWRNGIEEILITDYHIITAEGGTLDATGLSTVISTQSAVTLNYAGTLEQGSVCMWSVTSYDLDGNKTTIEVEDGMEISVTGNMVCSASVYVPSTYEKGNGQYYLNEDGDYEGKVIDFSNGSNPLSFSAGATAAVVDSDYLKVDSTTSTGTSNASITFNEPETGDKSYVLEFDANIEGASGTYGYIMLADKINGGDVAGARSSVWLTAQDGKIIIHETNHTILAGENISVKQGEWHNFRFEYNYVSSESLILVKVYIDNEWQCDIYTNGSNTETNSNYRAMIYVNKGQGTLSLDNMYLGYSTETVAITGSAQ